VAASYIVEGPVPYPVWRQVLSLKHLQAYLPLVEFWKNDIVAARVFCVLQVYHWKLWAIEQRGVSKPFDFLIPFDRGPAINSSV
jgi:hypothetical protein